MRGITLLLLTALVVGEVLSEDIFEYVVLPQGVVKGQQVTPDGLKPYFNFLGIPYAKPPLGNLRFKAPLPADAWNGTLDATKERSVCKQPSDVLRTLIGEEDCLFLNVYTPELPGSSSLKPVMVWIHGGGFLAGSGNKETQGPEFLLNSGIVYVSINYRLGIIGFLSTEDEVVAGNAGMKDQVLALQWVQQNIASFGGDPSQVTIVGESAGGASVHYHMLSPMSEGLFRGAISQSGSVSNPWALAKNRREYAFSVGRALDFAGDSSKQLVDFLRNVNADELLSTSLTTIRAEDQYRLMKAIHDPPSVEPIVEGETAFISTNPRTLMAEGKFHKVPYLTGVTSSEGLYIMAASIFRTGKSLEEVEEDFVKIFKPELRDCKKGACGKDTMDKIKSFYFGQQHLNNGTLENLAELCTDMFFADGVVNAVKEMSPLSSAPVYLYQFSFDGALGFTKLTMPDIANFSGAAHGDDLGYMFDFGVKVSDDSIEAKVRSRMVAMWTNFVKTGNPTPEATEDISVWLPYKSDETNYLDIGSELKMKKNLHKEREDFWDNIYNS